MPTLFFAKKGFCHTLYNRLEKAVAERLDIYNGVQLTSVEHFLARIEMIVDNLNRLHPKCKPLRTDRNTAGGYMVFTVFGNGTVWKVSLYPVRGFYVAGDSCPTGMEDLSGYVRLVRGESDQESEQRIQEWNAEVAPYLKEREELQQQIELTFSGTGGQ